MDGEYTTRGKNEVYLIPGAWRAETTSGIGWRNRYELNLLVRVGCTGMGFCERCHEHSVSVKQCFSTAGPWHQLYRAARGSSGSCHFSFLSIFHE